MVCASFSHFTLSAVTLTCQFIHSSNLLYPKEDRSTNQLMFSCRTCHVSEPATSYCVYQNKLNSQVGDTAGVTQDVGSDPTVCLPDFCTYCGEEIACFECGMPLENSSSEYAAFGA